MRWGVTKGALAAKLVRKVELVLLLWGLEHNSVFSNNHEARIAQVGCMQLCSLQHEDAGGAGALYRGHSASVGPLSCATLVDSKVKLGSLGSTQQPRQCTARRQLALKSQACPQVLPSSAKTPTFQILLDEHSACPPGRLSSEMLIP